MKKDIIFVAILVLLLLISVVQSFQLNSIKNQVEKGVGEIKTTGQKTAVASSPSSGGSGASIPPNIQNLPQMVGGC